MSSDDDREFDVETVEPEEADIAWIGGDDERVRNLFVGVFVLTVVAAFIPVITPLPLGYLLAALVWLAGIAGLYLLGYRRIQDRYEQERATLRRLLAGAAAAYLVFQILETSVRILRAGGGPTLEAARPALIVIAVIVAIVGAIIANPERLVWFVAAVFVLNFVVVQGIRAAGAQPVIADPFLAVTAYLGLVGLAAGAAFVLVYQGGARRLLDGFS
ncbi:MAG: hypothetical protein ABEJ35_01820 [Halobacteriaceae archaeon]